MFAGADGPPLMQASQALILVNGTGDGAHGGFETFHVFVGFGCQRLVRGEHFSGLCVIATGLAAEQVEPDALVVSGAGRSGCAHSIRGSSAGALRRPP